MLDDLSDAEFNALRQALRLAQQAGEAAQPGEMSYAELARWFHTSPADVKLTEEVAIEKIRSLLHV